MAKLYVPAGAAGPCSAAKATQLLQLLDQARVNARKPLSTTGVNGNDSDQTAPPLPPVTLPNLRAACMLPH